jgi:PHD/YefM family antitoxin component YafN of YafNO toxin-antitoxin module
VIRLGVLREGVMRFVTVRDLRLKARALWEKLDEEREVVLTSNGRPVAVLSAVDEATLEETIDSLRRARAMRAVRRMQEAAVANGLHRWSAGRVQAEIRAARQGRRR